ncbi:bifunctional diaminohydroxyphosphoribosylaminopyrimidine deaminase/5-amino-6-(5-phosphoribosylamino)uracil reductase RibD [Chromobacterium sp. IIBBL 290-4]|uniref:bifunctional diaminohydroxyphosphoribosylaminopyrimidine deaminase/5-amino-6-(5-phosphoribosylamino)uracil reductase RibD n=1 Tax=Chromobacterium sp. IIBBL 290-4 TaxID=2953890 RepID=UPI0020B83FD2|nr:bifunctional diaminohydroxyphosphoribosylaminopyrimidine deaminase/5-amino-6-(5-phosphoribosylamino)uracil reductase RibD [Chromobacterium sp. IIBBL 290-4]UTH74792.1 bifunctional diaminohydroxyphosphoribosylaminopyrimidine deaminase/5-amino-6-(5-phosphoribosylamino)uracil reductase RibD [Chromobacterium sp. IIBBL 290-4]
MTGFSADDHLYMQRALRLAEAATRRASPNPGVGCVLVRDGRVIGEGATLAVGSDHAEIQAIKDCLARGGNPRGSTAYVTLEPCSHYGRTPPCAGRLIDEGVARVVAAMVDPYHEVAGRGIAMLREAGIDAQAGLMEAEARRVHRGFLSRVTRGRPWVTLKAAATLDGKTALLNGSSKWITGPEARMDVQRLRAASCAILTGSGTVLADDPQLTVREIAVIEQPWRVVLDGALKTSPASRIYQGGRGLLAHGAADPVKLAPYLAAGVDCLALPAIDGKADLAELMRQLAQRGVNHLMVEAGAGLNGAMLQAGLVDEIVLYLAPSLAGDAARGLFAWPALSDLADKIRLDIVDAAKVGADLRLTLRPEARG